eukprot:SAG22_NODE_672_length_7974_cov_13.942857_1_plen_38_part_00
MWRIELQCGVSSYSGFEVLAFLTQVFEDEPDQEWVEA